MSFFWNDFKKASVSFLPYPIYIYIYILIPKDTSEDKYNSMSKNVIIINKNTHNEFQHSE